MRKSMIVITVLMMGMSAAWGGGPWHAVRDFGAVGDGVAKDTAAVQKAIDACAAAGGGTVYFAAGSYLCGSLHLKSHITLMLDNGAVILGSTSKDDYDPWETLAFKNDSDQETSYFHNALIWGEDMEYVAITGQGMIDCNFKKRHGPKAIALKRCRYVEITGVHLRNCPNYNISMLGTDYVNIDGVTIQNGHADGIDPDSCKNVRISNCHIEAWDDAIVPKTSFSLGERRACENITVTNCYLATGCNAFKLGTESGGDFKRITVSNCVMTGLEDDPAISGIALESVDGANIDGVTVSNITMINVRTPIFLRLGNRGRDMENPTPGSLQNVAISNVVATRAMFPCSITGIPMRRISGVTLESIRITYAGSNPVHPEGAPVPELEENYPEADMFGTLPTFGMYCRHVEGLILSKINFGCNRDFWRLTTPDDRKVNWSKDGAPDLSEPAEPGTTIFMDAVSDVMIEGLQGAPTEGAMVHFVNVRTALLQGCTPAGDTKTFLELSGEGTRNIKLMGNVLDGAEQAVKFGEGVRHDAVEAYPPLKR